MRTTIAAAVTATLLAVALAAPAPTPAAKKQEGPDAIVVQHCLIGFKRSVPGKKITRTKADARALAGKLLERSRAGEDFGELVKEYTDDRFPGILKITDHGAPVRAGYRSRDELAQGFGDLAFSLEVDEIGLVDYHGYRSPFGWHLIKRLE